MGNCFGKESGNFKGEGRPLGAAPASASAPSQNARAAAPPKISPPQGGRTLGKNPQAPDESLSPRAAAAKAAEVRSLSSTCTTEGLLDGKRQPRHRPSSRMMTTAWL